MVLYQTQTDPEVTNRACDDRDLSILHRTESVLSGFSNERQAWMPATVTKRQQYKTKKKELFFQSPKLRGFQRWPD